MEWCSWKLHFHWLKQTHCSLMAPHSFPLESSLAFVPYLVQGWWHYSPSYTDSTVFFVVLCTMLYMFQTLWFLCQELSCCWYVDIKAAICTNTARQQQCTSDIGSHVKMCQKPQQKPSKTPGNEPEGFKDAGHGAKSCNRHNSVD